MRRLPVCDRLISGIVGRLVGGVVKWLGVGPVGEIVGDLVRGLVGILVGGIVGGLDMGLAPRRVWG